MADRIWFGPERPFQAAREAFAHIETDLERWEQQIETERSQLAEAVLGVRPADIVAAQQSGVFTRISADSISLYSTEKRVNVCGFWQALPQRWNPRQDKRDHNVYPGSHCRRRQLVRTMK